VYTEGNSSNLLMKHPVDNNPATEEVVPSAEESSFGDILSQFESEHQAETDAERVQGTVVTVSSDFIYVDVGRKTEGVIPAADVKDRSGNVLLKPGDIVEVTIGPRNEEGNYQLSTIKIEQPKDWSALDAAFAEQAVIAGQVTETIKGGLRVDVAGMRAFMPASRSGARDQVELEKLVGQQVRCKIIKLDKEKDDIVVDRRVVIEEEQKRAKEERFGTINEGDVVTGTVRSVLDFGAFIDLGGVDGLLHVTDMSWTRIGKPADLLSAGQQVQVKVLKINRDTKKISLGMKQLQVDPWTAAAGKYNVGDRVRGTVARLTDFGAFVNLEPGIDGLVHLSEMSWSKKVRKPSDLVSVGDAVEVVVLGVNTAEKRISLGLKQALGDPWEEVEKKFAIGAVVEGTVNNLANFGAFVDLGEGVEGMIHVGDITREKRLEHPKEVLKAGQVVKAQVLELDRERRRIRLGMKQLEPTSADSYISEHQEGETVTGRVVEVNDQRARIELGEGVYATCKLKASNGSESKSTSAERPDLQSLTAMLSAKWKSGPAEKSSGGSDTPKVGQLRNFRILSLDPQQKRIQVELVS
jgi:small subunit ribosomal protein S1